MKKWDSLIEEKPSREHRDQIFKAVRPELDHLALKSRRSFWQSLFTGSIWSSTLAVVAGVVVLPRLMKQVEKGRPGEEAGAQMAKNMEILNDMELLEELDLLDELEFLEAASELDEVEG